LTPEYQIRKADHTDLDALVDFTLREATETESEAPEPGAVRLGVKAGIDGAAPVTYWVAQTGDGSLAGSVSVVTEWSNFRGGYYWWIQSLFILPDHRGRGLVNTLLGHVATRAAAAGALDLRLYVLESNQRAIAAYRRCGFDLLPYHIMRRNL
jgi:ribosomal protein S18 acetylase RimI-like enzyme